MDAIICSDLHLAVYNCQAKMFCQFLDIVRE